MARAEMGISQKHYAMIGRVASNWAALEFAIDFRCWTLAGLSDSHGPCLTAQISGSGRKMDALCSLMAITGRSASDLKAAVKLKEKIIGVAERRNRVVHDPWWKSPKNQHPLRYQITAKKVLVKESFPVSTEELRTLNERIIELEKELYNLVARPISKPSRKKSPK